MAAVHTFMTNRNMTIIERELGVLKKLLVYELRERGG